MERLDFLAPLLDREYLKFSQMSYFFVNPLTSNLLQEV